MQCPQSSNLFENLSSKLLQAFDSRCLEPCETYGGHLVLLTSAFNLINNSFKSFNLNELKLALKLSQAVKDRSWEYLNTGNWCDVPFRIRNIYAAACLLKVVCILRIGDGTSLEFLKKALSTIDSGILLGAGLGTQLKDAAAKISDSIYQEESLVSGIDLDSIEFSFKDSPDNWKLPGISGSPVIELNCPTLETFSRQFFQRTPAKLTNCLDHWAAMERWKKPGYLVRVGGGRKVPVEVGGQYTTRNWGMQLTTLRDFVLHHVLPESNSPDCTGYLAQHPLFNQIDELRNDIEVLDYCCVTDKDGDSEVDINAWFGPSGTVSPLHTDPKHNLLCQVIGRKRVILFSPEDSPKLYPYENLLMHNTAQVDPENPNFTTYPDFAEAQAFECHLFPGDVLYIPPKWWHHVRSLDISFSVSFWWE